jgi:histidinol phosphatase-like enzyme (inositol monophosphatase family)
MAHSLSGPDRDRFIAFLHRLADASGHSIVPHFRQALVVENKQARGFDPVTIADREAEAAIRALIRREYPDHSILGEEEDRFHGSSQWTWVIDPIDGTRAFMIGQPLWGTLIALNDGNRPVLGMLDQPYLGERFFGDARESLFTGPGVKRPLRARHGLKLQDAILSSTHPELFKSGVEAEAFRALSAQTRMTRYGGDCYSYGLVAMGLIDLVVETGLKPFDIQALMPIVEGAGGKIVNWRGGDCSGGGQAVASGDPRLLDQVLRILEPGAD